jgi:MFS family permease
MRLLQGLAVGGELPTTFVYISESMSSKRLLAFGITMAGVFCGYLFAAIINFIMTKTFSKEALNDYAWRLPFAIGGIVCFVSYHIRKTLRETKAFQEVMNKPKLPVVYLIKNFKPQIIAGIFFSATQQVFSIVGIIYMPSYMNAILKLDTAYISNLLPCALIATVIIIAAVGIYFNKLQNVYKLMLTSLILNLLIVPVVFFLISSKLHIISGYIILMALHGLIGLMIPLYITLLFPTNIRLSGVALCYNVSVATFGGTAPIIITTLLKETSLIYLVPVAYILIFVGLSILFTIATKKVAIENMMS